MLDRKIRFFAVKVLNFRGVKMGSPECVMPLPPRGDLAVMNAQVMSAPAKTMDRRAREVISPKRQNGAVHLFHRLSFEHRDHVVSAAARDNVLTARRYACRVDAVSNAATGHLVSLQDVIRTGQCRTAAERAEKVLQHLRSLQHALSKGRNAHRDSR